MCLQNIRSFGHHFRRLAPPNFSHITDVTQSPALFTSNQVSLLQLSRNWGQSRGEKGQGEQSHIMDTLDREHNYHTQACTLLLHLYTLSIKDV